MVAPVAWDSRGLHVRARGPCWDGAVLLCHGQGSNDAQRRDHDGLGAPMGAVSEPLSGRAEVFVLSMGYFAARSRFHNHLAASCHEKLLARSSSSAYGVGSSVDPFQADADERCGEAASPVSHVAPPHSPQVPLCHTVYSHAVSMVHAPPSPRASAVGGGGHHVDRGPGMLAASQSAAQTTHLRSIPANCSAGSDHPDGQLQLLQCAHHSSGLHTLRRHLLDRSAEPTPRGGRGSRARGQARRGGRAQAGGAREPSREPERARPPQGGGAGGCGVLRRRGRQPGDADVDGGAGLARRNEPGAACFSTRFG
mmetsp:Transcript_45643/g.85248  ORF Transcript_45643/g.85248 Transcript_45643/m.85248 type:complete len:310 (-) Transcript_45643:1228-2157(-)